MRTHEKNGDASSGDSLEREVSFLVSSVRVNVSRTRRSADAERFWNVHDAACIERETVSFGRKTVASALHLHDMGHSFPCYAKTAVSRLSLSIAKRVLSGQQKKLRGPLQPVRIRLLRNPRQGTLLSPQYGRYPIHSGPRQLTSIPPPSSPLA